MLNEKAYNNVLRIIDNCDDIENLTARRLAELSYTSPSSISRFVKKMGYSNFNEMKVRIIQEREMNNYSDSVIESWNAMFVAAYSEVSTDDLNIIRDNKNKKFYIYCDRIYSLITRQFMDALAMYNIDCMPITKENISRLKDSSNKVVISIGKLEKQLYRRDLEYIEIKFDRFADEYIYPNIQTVNLITPKILNLNSFNPSFRVACMHVYLSMMIDLLNEK